MSEMTDTEIIAGLHDLADFVEKNPHFAQQMRYLTLNLFPPPDEFRRYVSDLGGHRDKNAYGDYYAVERRFGGLTISLNVRREKVCEAVEVGRETVEVPDPDAPKITIERPIIEWQCADSLLAP